MDDGYAQLADDHRAVEAQLQALLRGDEAPVVRELGVHLARHLQLEDAALYPKLRRYVDGGDDLADRAAQEHAAIAAMLADVDGSATPERRGELLRQLGDAVSAHVAFEESEVFPAMRDCGVDGATVAAGLGAVESPAR